MCAPTEIWDEKSAGHDDIDISIYQMYTHPKVYIEILE